MSRKSRNMFYQNTSTSRSAEIKEFLLFMKDCVKKNASSKIGQKLPLEHFFCYPEKVSESAKLFVNKELFQWVALSSSASHVVHCIRSNSLAVHKPQICILSFINAENV